jgi:hypothetical protein
VQEEFGDMPAGFTTVGHIHGKVHKYLSQKWLQGGNHDIRESQIIALYSKLAGYTKAEARLSYLDYVRAWKIYGSTYFFAQPQSGTLPREVVIAVNGRGVLIIDAHTKEYVRSAACPCAFVRARGLTHHDPCCYWTGFWLTSRTSR